MDYMRIGKIYEKDIDSIIIEAGGAKLSKDASKEREINADYVFYDSVIELKIIEEEGLAKRERQQKLAELFRTALRDSPTIVLDPFQLNDADQDRYYKIMSTPIKTAVTKAAKQLKKSADNIDNIKSCGLIILNHGYGALRHEEFKELVLKRATQDTSSIDFIIIGGLYFFSDVWENYTLAPLEIISLRIGDIPAELFNIRKAWGDFINNFMTGAITGYEDRASDRLPLIDFEYELDGIRYVKPTPPIGKKSDIYPNGRPRNNSTGIEKCPPLAQTFPKLNNQEWNTLKRTLEDSYYLYETFYDWRSYEQENSSSAHKPLQPFVPVAVESKLFIDWCKKSSRDLTFHSLCLYANDMFETKVKKLISSATSINNSLCIPEYILFVIEEIGQDKANDYGSIIHITNNFEEKKEVILVENVRMFFEVGKAIAAAYAVKHNSPAVFFQRNRKYVWE